MHGFFTFQGHNQGKQGSCLVLMAEESHKIWVVRAVHSCPHRTMWLNGQCNEGESLTRHCASPLTGKLASAWVTFKNLGRGNPALPGGAQLYAVIPKSALFGVKANWQPSHCRAFLPWWWQPLQACPAMFLHGPVVSRLLLVLLGHDMELLSRGPCVLVGLSKSIWHIKDAGLPDWQCEKRGLIPVRCMHTA